MGWIQELSGNIRDSIHHEELALKIERDVGTIENVLDLLISLSNSYAEIEEYEKYVIYFREALKISDEIGGPVRDWLK